MEEVFQPSDHIHGPPLDFLQWVHTLFMLRALELDAVLQVVSHKGRKRGRIISFDLVAMLLLTS